MRGGRAFGDYYSEIKRGGGGDDDDLDLDLDLRSFACYSAFCVHTMGGAAAAVTVPMFCIAHTE